MAVGGADWNAVCNLGQPGVTSRQDPLPEHSMSQTMDGNTEQDRLLQFFFDLPFLGMAVVSPVTGRWLKVNDSLCEILGYPREALLEATWQQLTHPDDLAAEQIQFDRLAACEIEGYRQCKRYLRKDGGVVEAWVDVKCVRSLGVAGEDNKYMIMTVQASTERQRAEAATRAANEQLTALIEAMPDAVFLKDGENRWQVINQAAARLFQVRDFPWRGQSETDMAQVRPKFRTIHESCEASDEATWNAARPTLVVEHIRGPDGRMRQFEVHKVPLFEADGRRKALVVIGRDITERNRAEERLREHLRLTQAMTDCAAESIFVTDQDGRITFVNPEAERVFGYTPSEFLGRNLHDLIHHHYPDGRPYPAEECPNCRIYTSGESVRHQEVVLFRKDGSQVTMTCSNAQLEIGGEPSGAVLIAHDITAHKRAEEALREADRRKDEFLAMLAHELRNPLVPIRNAAHVLGQLQLDEPQVRWAQALIEHQVGHLTRLVEDLLDVSRIVRGKIVLKREPVEFATLIQQAMETAGPVMEAKGHAFVLDIPPDPVWLSGDPVRLTQVLINLLDNAAKYTPEHGRIELRARVSSGELGVEVRDNGPGIPPELQPWIFDLFQQGERTLERAQGGLGIGLTLVKKLVELHDGRVEVYSAGLGRGTTFTVHLPVSAESHAPQPSPPRVSEARRGQGVGRVLVVDDEPAVAESTAVFLRLEGYEVRTADSGESALREVSEFQPGVVLLDIGLPGQDGYEVARRMRQLQGGAALKLVAVSGYGHHEAVARSQEVGFDHHLVKPVDPGELTQLLAR